jgi:acetyl esterase
VEAGFDRQETWSQRNFTDTSWSDRDTVAAAWRHYLGVHRHAAPARAAELFATLRRALAE